MQPLAASTSHAEYNSPVYVAGVDGCPAGWIVALACTRHEDLHALQFVLCPHFDDVLHLDAAPTVIAVDMPIGLLSEPQPGGRLCDRQARRLLGRRASSVFSPPSRRILHAVYYDEVRTQGMSRQAFGILPKIREVDRLMTPALQNTIYEAHPELAFTAAAGAPMRYNKKTAAGREERLQVLEQTSAPRLPHPSQLLSRGLNALKRTQAAADDLLDAMVLTRTAYRIATARATCLPPDPPADSLSLRMEIWF
jgi:predicted RNase H-like nuclease